MRNFVLVSALVLAVGCGGSQASGGGASAAVDGDTFNGSGVRLQRPANWTFVPADSSVAPDTVVIVQGPVGADEVAPVVEVSRRPLSAMDQRKKPSSILATMVTEIAQLFDGFELVGSPEDVQIAGSPGARMGLKYTESMPDGTSVQRAGRFYGVVRGEQIWVMRCIGPADGSADGSFEQIIGTVEFGS